MKVFISSTSVDLKEHRRAAAEALERSGYELNRMETFGAQPTEPTAACFQEIASTDVMVGIYAHKYGFVPSECEASITELEFDFAKPRGRPIFCFLIDEDHAWPPRMIDNQEPARSKLIAFKKRLRETMTVDWFTSPEDLSVKITTSLSRHIKKENLRKTALQLDQFMSKADLDTRTLAQGRNLADVSNHFRDRIKSLLDDFDSTLGTIQISQNDRIDLESLLSFTKGLLASGRWLDAARELEEYAIRKPDNWEASYLRGVAYANARGGQKTNLGALRACNDTIAFAPLNLDLNLRSRFFS